MIEIVRDKSYRDASGAERFVVKDGEEITCEAKAVLTRECARIISISFESPVYRKFFADGLIRTVLNAADLRGIKRAVCFDSSLFDILKEIGFKEEKEDGSLCVSLCVPLFFAGGCKSDM